MGAVFDHGYMKAGSGVFSCGHKKGAASVDASTLAVGSSVWLNVDETPYEFLVVHQGNPSTSMYESSCNGTWMLMKNIYENRAYSSNYNSDFSKSDLLTYLNADFKDLLDTNVQDSIIRARIPYGSMSATGTCSVKSKSNGARAYIFVLGAYEVGFTTADNVCEVKDGAKLDYFDSANARLSNYNGVASSWWLRTPYPVGSTALAKTSQINIISPDGSLSLGMVSSDTGIRPAMIFPSDMQFTLDSNGRYVPA